MELVAKLSENVLFYKTETDKYKRCAVVLSNRLAWTYAHGENKNFKVGNRITIYSPRDNSFEASTQVVKVIPLLDTIILQSDVDLCCKNLITEADDPGIGTRYLMVFFYLFLV